MLFENKKHEVYIVNKHKVALNRDDDKRCVQTDGIKTLSRGYFLIIAIINTYHRCFYNF